MNPQMTLETFEKSAIDFVVTIQPQGKTGARYIITTTEYLTRWAEAQPIKDYTGATAVKFLFDMYWRSLAMSDRGTHFLNETISTLTEEFQVYHQKSTPYHPQANGMAEEFNKVLEDALTKVFNA